MAINSGDSFQQTGNSLSRLYVGFALVIGVIIGMYVLILHMNKLGTIIVDNPTHEDIKVSIDDNDYEFVGGTWRVKIPYAISENTTVTLDGKVVGTFTRGMFDGDSLINPTLATYVRQSYAYTDTSDNKVDGKIVDGLEENTVCLDGKEYTGYNLKLYTGLYISKDRDYGLDEISPSEKTMNGDYEIVTELLRAERYMDDEKGHKARKDC